LGSLAGEVEQAGASILAIAVTATFSQQEFASSLGVTFPLLSDWDGEVCANYGVRYDSWKGHSGLAKRSLFVIDTDHLVRYAWHTENAEELPNLHEAVMAAGAV
jgi:glutaredoxin-dependent peroxiredoxin